MRPEPSRACVRRPARAAGAVLAATLVVTLAAGCTTGSTGAGGTSGAPPADTSGTPTGPTTPITSPPTTPTAPPADTGVTAPPPTAGTTPAGGPSPATVQLVVTYSGWDAKKGLAEVDAFAPGVLATDGRCTLTMTRGDVSRVASREASAGPSSTQCGALIINGRNLTDGTWQAVVRFTSSAATGTSDPVTITVAK